MNPQKRDYYSLIQKAREVYRQSGNISAFLRDSLGLEENTPEIIEIAYDLQAGSYIDHFRKYPEQHLNYYSELASYLSQYLESGMSLLEVGCGEATTTVGVLKNLSQIPNQIMGFDISFSRIRVALDFWLEQKKNSSFAFPGNSFFVADLFHIPLFDKSVDVVYTSHSIEPNGGREVAALESILRIARKRVLLFEPYFEKASPEGQERMARHGYIKNIPEAIKQAGGILHDIKKIEHAGNPLNPTYLFDIEIPSEGNLSDSSSPWADPLTLAPLIRNENYFYCPTSGLAYPQLKGIPCLRPENAILATYL